MRPAESRLQPGLAAPRVRGFTLLEVLVATVIMAIAVTALLTGLTTSLRNGARLTDYDRATLLARQKMDELLIASDVPKSSVFSGVWDASLSGGVPSGWQARITPYEMPEGTKPGAPILERVELQVWWDNGDRRRTFALEGFRRAKLTEDGQ
jgi:general secretion pathway protein I